MFTLKSLPYSQEALAPIMSAQTLELHHDKHHKTYVDNLNKLITGTELESLNLEEIVVTTAKDVDRIAIFNNAGQVYNHNIFWESLKPVSINSQPGPKTAMLLEKSFGGLENFYNDFKALALSQFGSGWAWLVKDGERLKIMKTANADSPLTSGLKPLLGIDVWEHAYYLDYQNRRADFLESVLRQLINWQFVEDNL